MGGHRHHAVHHPLVHGRRRAALFNTPLGITFDRQGNIVVADSRNNRIRRIAPSGAVTTVAGSGRRSPGGKGPLLTSVKIARAGSADGSADSAQFFFPQHVALDCSDNIIVADRLNHCILCMTLTKTIRATTASPFKGMVPDRLFKSGPIRVWRPGMTHMGH